MQTEQALYALCPGADPNARPVAFSDADGLARHIHRQRGQDSLQLRDGDLLFSGEPKPRRVVEVYADGHDRCRLIGRAWLKGRGRDSLQAALERAQPQARRRG